MEAEGAAEFFFSFPHFFVVFLVMLATWCEEYENGSDGLHISSSTEQTPAGMGHMTDSS